MAPPLKFRNVCVVIIIKKVTLVIATFQRVYGFSHLHPDWLETYLSGISVPVITMLAELHWLPVTARIEFQLTLLTFRILISHQPSYLRELLQPHRPSRQLRSSSHNLLDIPRTRTVFAQRIFSQCAPRIWNSLLDTITCDLNVTTCTFKRRLKTFFFSNCYS